MMVVLVIILAIWIVYAVNKNSHARRRHEIQAEADRKEILEDALRELQPTMLIYPRGTPELAIIKDEWLSPYRLDRLKQARMRVVAACPEWHCEDKKQWTAFFDLVKQEKEFVETGYEESVTERWKQDRAYAAAFKEEERIQQLIWELQEEERMQQLIWKLQEEERMQQLIWKLHVGDLTGYPFRPPWKEESATPEAFKTLQQEARELTKLLEEQYKKEHLCDHLP